MIHLSDFDAPFFKRIPKNESSVAKGKQSGFVIPKRSRMYFPKLALPGPANWVPDTQIDARLIVNGIVVEVVSTRYQNQTWSGTRDPGEFRITGQLGALIHVSMPGDLLLFRRHLQHENFYVLELISRGTATFSKLQSVVGERSSGPVYTSSPPITDIDIFNAEREQAARESNALKLFDNDASLIETRVKRIARSKAFTKRLSVLYGNKCCVCGAAMKSHTGRHETEGAHVVSRSLKGVDDARNGLLLCRSHHWAFDMGMFGLTVEREVYVRVDVAADPANAALAALQGKTIATPTDLAMKVDEDALAWHRKEIVREDP